MLLAIKFRWLQAAHTSFKMLPPAKRKALSAG